MMRSTAERTALSWCLLLAGLPCGSFAAAQNPAPEQAPERPKVYLQVARDAADKALSPADVDTIHKAVGAALAADLVEKKSALVEVTVVARRQDRTNRFGRNFLDLTLDVKAKSVQGADALFAKREVLRVKTLRDKQSAFRQTFELPEFRKFTGELRDSISKLPVLVCFYLPDSSEVGLRRWGTRLAQFLGADRVEGAAPPAGLKSPPDLCLKVKSSTKQLTLVVSKMLEDYYWPSPTPSEESIRIERADRMVVKPIFTLNVELVFPPEKKGIELEIEEFLVRTVGRGNVLPPVDVERTPKLKLKFEVQWENRPLALHWKVLDFLQRNHSDLLVEGTRTDYGFRFEGSKAHVVAFHMPSAAAQIAPALEERLDAIVGPGNHRFVEFLPARGFRDAFRMVLKSPRSAAQLRGELARACKEVLAGESAASRLPVKSVPIDPPARGDLAVAYAYDIQADFRGARSRKNLRPDLLERLRPILGGGSVEDARGEGSSDVFGFRVTWTREPDALKFDFLGILAELAPELEAADRRVDGGFAFELGPRKAYTLGITLPGRQASDFNCVQKRIEQLDQVVRVQPTTSPVSTIVPHVSLGVEFTGKLSEFSEAATATLQECLGGPGIDDVKLRSYGPFLHFAAERWEENRLDILGSDDLRGAISAAFFKDLAAQDGVDRVEPIESSDRLSFRVKSSYSTGALALLAEGILAEKLAGKGVVDIAYDTKSKDATLTMAPQRKATLCFHLPPDRASEKLTWLERLAEIPGVRDVQTSGASAEGELCVSLHRSVAEVDFLSRVQKEFETFFRGGDYSFAQRVDSKGYHFEAGQREGLVVEIEGLAEKERGAALNWLAGLDGVRTLENIGSRAERLLVKVDLAAGRDAFLIQALKGLGGALGDKTFSYSLSDGAVFLKADRPAAAAAAEPSGADLVAADRLREALLQSLVSIDGGFSAVILETRPDRKGVALVPDAAFKGDHRAPIRGTFNSVFAVHLSFSRVSGTPGYVYADVTDLPPTATAFPVSRDRNEDALGEITPAAAEKGITVSSAGGGGEASSGALVLGKSGLLGVRRQDGGLAALDEEIGR